MSSRFKESDYGVAWLAFHGTVVAFSWFVTPLVIAAVRPLFYGWAPIAGSIVLSMAVSFAAFRFFVDRLVVRKLEQRLTADQPDA